MAFARVGMRCIHSPYPGDVGLMLSVRFALAVKVGKHCSTAGVSGPMGCIHRIPEPSRGPARWQHVALAGTYSRLPVWLGGWLMLGALVAS